MSNLILRSKNTKNNEINGTVLQGLVSLHGMFKLKKSDANYNIKTELEMLSNRCHF